jgi:aldose 1-epimerase
VFDGGAFPMAPWPNRIAHGRFEWGGREVALPTNVGGHALHGLVHDQPWRVLARTARVCELACELPAAWPWPGSAWQRIELGDGYLRLKLEVRATREPFPAACGWHPWFRRDAFGAGDATVTVPARERYVLDDHIPTGETVTPSGSYDLREGGAVGDRRLDDCYRALTAPVCIRWGEVALELDMSCQAPHVMVYTPPQAVCVEPQTAAPDAFNLVSRGVEGTGFAIASPGRPVSMEVRWSWRPVPAAASGSATRPASRT